MGVNSFFHFGAVGSGSYFKGFRYLRGKIMNTCDLRQNRGARVFSSISIPLIFFLLVGSVPAFAEDANSIDSLRRMGKAFASIAEKTVSQGSPEMRGFPFGEPFDPFNDDFFDYFFHRQLPRSQTPRPKARQLAQGSGFIISPDGYILTNNHLIGDAEKVTVKLGENTELEAKVIGTDPESDVAVIKIDKDNLPFLELANSDSLEVGEWVIAIGNPFGLSHTVTAGIVSAKGRSGFRIADYEDFIQTDAAINPGNSGGPLLNLDAKVVGINTAIVSRTGGNLGIGLAIPVNMAKTAYEQLVKGGTVVRGFLGVSIQDLTAELAKSFNLKETKGVLIADVTRDSAADKAGLKQGDIVVEFDGQHVDKASVLQSRVATLKPGTSAKVVVLRDGDRKEFTVEIGKRPPKDQLAAGKSQTLKQLGISVQNLTSDIAERFGYQGLSGVVVAEVEPGSLAELAGITQGTLIMEVNRKAVKNTKDFGEAVEQASREGSVLLLIKDEQYSRFVVLTLPKK